LQELRVIGKTVSHYRILEKLGEGGMGVVYKAEDTKLKRTVALKFLPPELTRDPKAKARFIHEAQAASALQHHNICTIHEIDETPEGQLFISMDCYEGQTLKERISKGPLPLGDALDLTIQAAEGLSKAHGAGMVHRDIKPANIMITSDGVAKILDFGLAKFAGQTKATNKGMTVGTVAYMSPEQARGEEVDHRTDIWSLSVVLYEMLTGLLPFRAEHEAALLYCVVHEDPQPLFCFRTDIPMQVASVISKALQKDRALRYQTAKELISELSMLTDPGMQLSREEKSIVVLPFENLSPDPDQEYFSDGLTEEVISDLSNVRALRVISRSSAMTFKGTRKKVPEIARELNVQYALEGSVRKAGNSLRITAQLIDATNDAHLWAEKYSGTLDDVFDIQEKVSRSIVDALRLRLTDEEKLKMAERPIDDVLAYECYLRAQYEILRYDEDALDRAVQYLQNGIDIVGDNALLYSGIAQAYSQYVNIGAKQEDYIAKAEEYAKEALALDPDFPKAHQVLAFIYSAFRGNQQDAIRHYKRALAVNPNEPAALISLAYTYCYAGKPSAALTLMERLKRVDPLRPGNYFLQGALHFCDSQYRLALEPFRKFHESDPGSLSAQFLYAWTLTYNKELDRAFSMIDQIAGADPNNVYAKFGLLLKYGLLKDKEKALQEMTPDFQKTCRRDLEWSYSVAVMLSLLDARKEALDWLENAVSLGFMNYPMLERDPFLDNIRTEESFKNLVQRVRYEWENFEV
jgi:eukaryotic-like serine/threonine-protein kinase